MNREPIDLKIASVPSPRNEIFIKIMNSTTVGGIKSI